MPSNPRDPNDWKSASGERGCGTCLHMPKDSLDYPCSGCVATPVGGGRVCMSEWEPAAPPTGLPDQPAGIGHNGGPPLDPLPENPKAIYGRSKPSLSLIPAGASLRISVVFRLGAEKYGPFNWRKDAVSASTYMDAAQRHMAQWFDGEDVDPESGQLHLAHAAACMMILLDAEAVGKLIDDRPHKGAASRLISEMTTPILT